MDRALARDLKGFGANLIAWIGLETDHAVEAVDHAGPALDATRAILRMNLGVLHVDGERRQLPALPFGVKLERHRHAGAESRREQVVRARAAAEPAERFGPSA